MRINLQLLTKLSAALTVLLTALDKAISSTVNAARGIDKNKTEDAQSVKSHASVQSRPKSEAEYSQKSGVLIKKKEV